MSKSGYDAPPTIPPNRPQHTGSSTNPFLDPSYQAPLQPAPTGPNPFRTNASPSSFAPGSSSGTGTGTTSDKMSAPALAQASAPDHLVAGSSSAAPDSRSPVAPTAAPPAQAPAAQAAQAEDPMDVALPDEPPPAYTPAAGQADSTTLQAGPQRMDFSGPPPLPDRFTQPQARPHTQSTPTHAPPPQGPPPMRPMEANITGVGMGYGPRVHPQHTGAGQGPSEGYTSPTGPPPALPHRPSGFGNAQSPPPPPPQQHQQQQQNHAPPKPDLTPTEVPVPGRPLLWRGMLLVYPKGFWCQKCGNTGFKQMDPSNPHETDWKKYGKKYTSALAHSYTVSPSAQGNPSTTGADNFQRPLPGGGGPPHQPLPPQPPHGSSTWDHPGHNRPPPPPPGQGWGGGGGPGWGPPQQRPPMIMSAGNWIPANAMVVRPGDPRLGGYPCPRCRGNGRETDWLGFDDGKCWQCSGVGRVW